MRLWTLSPQYLDTKGLLALWRETLLARHVIEGKTRGYRMHPQLIRFKQSPDPLAAIHKYLESIYQESEQRNYKFDKSKFSAADLDFTIPVTLGQVEYELGHLKKKLVVRDPERIALLPAASTAVELSPIFNVVAGDVEDWEIR